MAGSAASSSKSRAMRPSAWRTSMATSCPSRCSACRAGTSPPSTSCRGNGRSGWIRSGSMRTIPTASRWPCSSVSRPVPSMCDVTLLATSSSRVMPWHSRRILDGASARSSRRFWVTARLRNSSRLRCKRTPRRICPRSRRCSPSFQSRRPRSNPCPMNSASHPAHRTVPIILRGLGRVCGPPCGTSTMTMRPESTGSMPRRIHRQSCNNHTCHTAVRVSPYQHVPSEGQSNKKRKSSKFNVAHLSIISLHKCHAYYTRTASTYKLDVTRLILSLSGELPTINRFLHHTWTASNHPMIRWTRSRTWFPIVADLTVGWCLVRTWCLGRSGWIPAVRSRACAGWDHASPWRRPMLLLFLPLGPTDRLP
mmetsp:Transcript_13162/g.36358  ORF Transcript_13162/g.36358 Transcript_13162/m.36358 type:complete len:366 (+) Transcript_13162:68-1165(+)